MHNFRKRTPGSRQTMDGFVGAPSRQPAGATPQARHTMGAGSVAGVKRPVDGFKRPDGFYPSNRNLVNDGMAGEKSVGQPASHTHQPRTQGESILNMTLPSGRTLRGKKQKSKKPHTKWGLIRHWGLRATAVIVVIALLGAGFLFSKAYFKVNKVFKGGGAAAALQANVEPSLLKGEGDGRVNMLFLGRGGTGHDGPDLTDTILLVSIDPVNKSTAMVSIPRDLWVQSAGSGSKINAVFANAKYKAQNKYPKDVKKAEQAGINAIEQTVTSVLGVPIHYYAMVDFKAFQQAVDTVGGVDINVPETLTDYSMAWENGGNAVLAKKGPQHFDGKHALMYVRSRHGSARGDFDRAERQRLFITALSKKVLSAGTYTNPVKISQLLSAFGDHVTTDLSISDGLRLVDIVKAIPDSSIASVGLADPPNVLVNTGNYNGQSIVKPVAGMGDFSQIQSFIRNKLRDSYIANENAKIAVLNGTATAGLAGTKGDQLKSYGYNVTKVADAPTQTYTKTVLVDLTKGKKRYTQNYLEKRFNVKAVTKLPDATIQPEGADFVIILGSNERP